MNELSSIPRRLVSYISCEKVLGTKESIYSRSIVVYYSDKILGEYWNDRSRYGVTMREHLSGFIDSDGANV